MATPAVRLSSVATCALYKLISGANRIISNRFFYGTDTQTLQSPATYLPVIHKQHADFR
jgi:hypothetical protein